MNMVNDSENGAIISALESYSDAEKKYGVQGRGRPERNPTEAAIRILRRRVFGQKLRKLREDANLTLSEAARLSGIASPRKLSQYETTCYPPGDIVMRLAPHYGITLNALGSLVLMHSDPVLYEAITGREGYEPSLDDVSSFLEGSGE